MAWSANLTSDAIQAIAMTNGFPLDPHITARDCSGDYTG
jgi:hypothetical protein